MFGSQNNKNNNFVLALYKDTRTVYRLKDIALLTGEVNFQSLNKKLNYYVRTGVLLNLRKGIYAKPVFKMEELACAIYSPSYISLEYVLHKAGIVFQYDSRITTVSYLSRSIGVAGQTFLFRKIKGEILVNTNGVYRNDNHINIASEERAFLDLLYLNGDCYFDNLNPLNSSKVFKLLPVYQSKALTERAKKLFQK
jgi:hypothetical protein